MNRDTTKVIAAVTIGLGLATIAYRASQPPKKPGRGTWKAKKDILEYDYIIIGGNVDGEDVNGVFVVNSYKTGNISL